MTAYLPDTWNETFLFGVEDMDGDEVQFAGITEDITGLDFGEKGMDGIAIANGGRLNKFTPQGDESVTLKVWERDCGTDGAGFAQLFNWLGTEDTTDPLLVPNTRTRKPFQIIFTWADNLSSLATAGTATVADHAAYRISIRNAFITSRKINFDDKNMNAEITFKWTPFGRDSYANKKEESTESTAIPVKTDFTSANRYSSTG